MPKWTPLNPDELKYHPYQDAFWKARRLRVCIKCKTEFNCPEHMVCPACGGPGLRKFHRLLMMSGRRGGKTVAGAVGGSEEACVPNTIGWACAPTNQKLHRYVIPAFRKLIPMEWVKDWSSEYNDLVLKNGSLIHFQTLEDPDQGRGQGLDWLWIDEVCELTDMHWHVIRPSLTERQGGAFFTTSPRGYDWVYKEFFHRAEDGSPGYWAAKYTTADNPIISKSEIEEARLTMPEDMFRQEYLADFVIFEGAVYGNLIDQQILFSDEQIRKVIPEWPEIASWRQIYVGLDTGADHPFGAVKAVTTERGLVVIGEYLERNKAFYQHSNAIKRLAGSPNSRFCINKNEKQGMLELAQHGINCQGSENDVVAGIERVKSWLHTRQLWFIQPLCPKTVKEMQAYRWSSGKSSDGQLRKEKVYKLEDELPDCIRYICMGFPTLPQAPPADDVLPRSLEKMPDEMRASIERMRRIDGRKPERQEAVGDFWM